MSNFTTELRYLLVAGYEPSLENYPIFDETYRATLNQKILDHFYFQEIGLETPDRFDFYLKTRMNEIMPYFNKLYTQQALMVNPLYNFSMTETNNRQTAGTNVSATTGNDSSLSKFTKGKQTSKIANSDTPQGNLSIFDLTTGGYASNIQVGEQTFDQDETESANLNSLSTTGEATSTDEYVKTVIGNQGASTAEMFTKFRESLMNIDLAVINSLNDLFMGVY